MNLICTVILACSIILAGVFIGINMNTDMCSDHHVDRGKALLTQEEAADYMNMDDETFARLLRIQEIHLNNKELAGRGYEPSDYIQYLDVFEEKYFSIEELDYWIKKNMLNQSIFYK